LKTSMKVISLDVWGTLLDTDIFFNKIAEELSSITNRRKGEILKGIQESYRKMKYLRREGMLNDNNIVEECLEILSTDLKINDEHIRNSVVKVILHHDLHDLVKVNALKTIAKLHNYGFKLVTLGNVVYWPGAYNRIILEILGFSRYIELQMYADEIKCSKPRKCAFLKLCEKLRVKPENVVHVGDDIYDDFIGALQAGLKAILIEPSFERVYKLKEVAYIIPSIREILDIILTNK